MKYLLNFSNEKLVYDNINYENNYLFKNYNPKYAYEFVIDVVNKTNLKKIENKKYIKIHLDHQFIMINYKNKWYVLDAYIKQREFQYNVIDPMTLSQFIVDSRVKFDIKLWNQLFNVNVYKSDVKIAISQIFRHNWYNSNEIKNKFIELVDKSIDRLDNEEIGRDVKHLYLIEKSLNKEKAREYLNGLYKLADDKHL